MRLKAAILKFLHNNGEQLDAEIAKALNIRMAQLRTHVAQLSSARDVICCRVTRYVDGKMIEGISCRLSCDMPASTRGRKPGPVREKTDLDSGINQL